MQNLSPRMHAKHSLMLMVHLFTVVVWSACEVWWRRIQLVNGLQMDQLSQGASQLLATWRRRAVLLQRTLQVFHTRIFYGEIYGLGLLSCYFFAT